VNLIEVSADYLRRGVRYFTFSHRGMTYTGDSTTSVVQGSDFAAHLLVEMSM
jgi:hypothetical protein